MPETSSFSCCRNSITFRGAINKEKEGIRGRGRWTMGYVLRVRLASFFTGAAAASFLGLYILHRDYKIAQDSFTKQVAIIHPPLFILSAFKKSCQFSIVFVLGFGFTQIFFQNCIFQVSILIPVLLLRRFMFLYVICNSAILNFG